MHERYEFNACSMHDKMQDSCMILAKIHCMIMHDLIPWECEPLKQALLQRYSEVNIYPFIVGSLGSWFPGNDQVLSSLRIGHRYSGLMRRLCVVSAIAALGRRIYGTIPYARATEG